MCEESVGNWGPGLLDALSRIEDPRKPKGVRHPLPTVLALAVCAMLSGARSSAPSVSRAGTEGWTGFPRGASPTARTRIPPTSPKDQASVRNQRRGFFPRQVLAIRPRMGQRLGQRSFVYERARSIQDAGDLNEGIFRMLGVIANSEVDDQVE